MRHLQWLLFVVTMHSWWIWTNILPWKTHFFLVGFVCPRGSRTFASIENPYCPWVEQMVTGQSFTTNFMFNLLELEFEDRSGSYSEWVIHVRVKRQDPTVSGTCLATCWLLSNSSWPANKKHGRERVCVCASYFKGYLLMFLHIVFQTLVISAANLFWKPGRLKEFQEAVVRGLLGSGALLPFPVAGCSWSFYWLFPWIALRENLHRKLVFFATQLLGMLGFEMEWNIHADAE